MRKKIVFKSRIEPILTYTGEVIRLNCHKEFKDFENSIYKDSDFVKHYKLFSGQCGVYRFNSDGQPLYIGYSMNLKERVRRSFFNHAFLRPRVTFQYVLCDSKEEAMRIEAYYIGLLKPIFNYMGSGKNPALNQDMPTFTPEMKIYFNKWFKDMRHFPEGESP